MGIDSLQLDSPALYSFCSAAPDNFQSHSSHHQTSRFTGVRVTHCQLVDHHSHCPSATQCCTETRHTLSASGPPLTLSISYTVLYRDQTHTLLHSLNESNTTPLLLHTEISSVMAGGFPCSLLTNYEVTISLPPRTHTQSPAESWRVNLLHHSTLVCLRANGVLGDKGPPQLTENN